MVRRRLVFTGACFICATEFLRVLFASDNTERQHGLCFPGNVKDSKDDLILNLFPVGRAY
jgi:hypothetical protein